MRGLAQFVMKGRREAILAVVLIGIIPLGYLVSPVLVGLLILRRGLQETALVLIWAMLPLLVWALFPIMVADAPGNYFPVWVLLAVSALAVVLRSTASWQITLLSAIAIGLVFEAFMYLQPTVVDTLLEQVTFFMEQRGVSDSVSRAGLITLLCSMHVGMAVLLLMWARWLQSLLFNPGGFNTEFQSLRIEVKVALPLTLLILMSGYQVIVPEFWIVYFAMPLLVSGTALVHATVALKKLSRVWLFLFYLVFLSIAQFVILFALVDSWFDFRKNMRKTT